MLTSKTITAILFISLLSACSSMITATRDEPIKEDKTERSFGEMIDDEVIETKALVNLRKASPALQDAHLIVVSYNGTVLLAGQVPTEDHIPQAGATVEELGEVRTLHNQLTAEPNTSFGTRVSDSWITSKLKTKLLTDETIGSTPIKVVTENSIVYLLGLVSRDVGAKSADLARNTSGVEQVVKIFEYID